MNSSQQTANNTIDLHRLMMLCRKHIKMLIIWTLLAGVLGYVVAQFVVVPKYTATTEIFAPTLFTTLLGSTRKLNTLRV